MEIQTERKRRDLPGQRLFRGEGWPLPKRRRPRPRPRPFAIAWRCSWGGHESIVAATSRGKAVALYVSWMLLEYRILWTGVRCLRAPRHDAWAAGDATNELFAEADLPAGVDTDRPDILG